MLYRVDTPDGHLVSTGDSHGDAIMAALQHQSALGRLGCELPSSGDWLTTCVDTGSQQSWRVSLSRDGVMWAVLWPTHAGRQPS